MNATIHALSVVIGGAVAAGGAAVVNAVHDWRESRPFMHVSRLDVSPVGSVLFEREVVSPPTFADWSVVIVGSIDSDPICEGHGWAEYTPSEPQIKVMTLDEFSGDSGCWERMGPGEYRGRAYWVPRDGRGVVIAEFDVVKDATAD